MFLWYIPLCTLLCEVFVKYPTDKAKSTQRTTSKVKELFHYLFLLCVLCGFINALSGFNVTNVTNRSAPFILMLFFYKNILKKHARCNILKFKGILKQDVKMRVSELNRGER